MLICFSQGIPVSFSYRSPAPIFVSARVKQLASLSIMIGSIGLPRAFWRSYLSGFPTKRDVFPFSICSVSGLTVPGNPIPIPERDLIAWGSFCSKLWISSTILERTDEYPLSLKVGILFLVITSKSDSVLNKRRTASIFVPPTSIPNINLGVLTINNDPFFFTLS